MYCDDCLVFCAKVLNPGKKVVESVCGGTELDDGRVIIGS
jgi:hypothetical protein